MRSPTIPLYRPLDLNATLSAVHLDWAGRIIQATRTHGAQVVKHGRGPGSLEPEETAGLDYTVLDGHGVQEHLPWLWTLYHALVPDIGDLLGSGVHVSEDVASSINVNLLQGAGARYEAHVDAQPYTLLLFVTSHPPDSGGRLVLGDDTREIGISPRSGHGVLFDGATIPHKVEPLRTRADDAPLLRVSIPMVYLPTGVSASDRAAELDGYLFSETP